MVVVVFGPSLISGSFRELVEFGRIRGNSGKSGESSGKFRETRCLIELGGHSWKIWGRAGFSAKIWDSGGLAQFGVSKGFCTNRQGVLRPFYGTEKAHKTLAHDACPVILDTDLPGLVPGRKGYGT